MECPGQSQRECSECFSIARNVLADIKMHQDRKLSLEAAQLLAENAGLQNLLEQPAVDTMSCTQRQYRAQIIGKTAAFGESYQMDDGDSEKNDQ